MGRLALFGMCYLCTLVNASQPPVVHLVRTVEDHHIFSQAAAHVLCGLCLPCPRWTRWCSPHTHAQSLGQGDVASE